MRNVKALPGLGLAILLIVLGLLAGCGGEIIPAENPEPPSCVSIVDATGQEIVVDGAPIFSLDDESPRASSRGIVKTVLVIRVTAANGPTCHPVEIRKAVFMVNSLFAIKEWSIWTERYEELGRGTEFENGVFINLKIKPAWFVVKPGQVRKLIVIMNTTAAISGDILWITFLPGTEWVVAGETIVHTSADEPIEGWPLGYGHSDGGDTTGLPGDY